MIHIEARILIFIVLLIHGYLSQAHIEQFLCQNYHCNSAEITETVTSRLLEFSDDPQLHSAFFEDSPLASRQSNDGNSMKRQNSQFTEQSTLNYSEVIDYDELPDHRLAQIVSETIVARLLPILVYKFDSPISGLDNSELEQLAAGPNVNDTLCSEQLGELLVQMQEMSDILEIRRQDPSRKGVKFQERHLRLAQVLDSFGRYEAGFLLGRTHSLGSYNQCKKTKLLLNNELVTSRYCVANLDVSPRFSKQCKLESSLASDHLISVAVCLPESCHTRNFVHNKDLLQTLVNSQFELPASIYQERHLQLDSVFCELDSDSPLVKSSLSAKLLLIFVTFWIGAVLYSTYYSGRLKGNRLIACLNLKISWDEFICQRTRNFEGTKRRVSLDTINPIKVIGCMFVVAGHSLLISFGASLDIIQAIEENENNPKIFFILSMSIITDTFYVITGIIISFLEMEKSDKVAHKRQRDQLSSGNDHANNSRREGESGKVFLRRCALLIRARYLRLVPLYFLVFWFKKSLMTSLSSGPMWDHGYNRKTEAGLCREESWFTPFIFSAAYMPLSKQCLPQAWSIASDLSLSIMIAPFIVAMVRRPLLSAFVATAACIASSISMLVAFLDIDPDSLEGMAEGKLLPTIQISKEMSSFYTAPHYRVSSIMIGVLAGYILHHYSKATDSKQKLYDWPSWFKGPLTKAAIYYVFISFGGPIIFPSIRETLIKLSPLNKILFVHMLTTNRTLWALSNAIIFLRMITDWKDNYWMKQSAGRFWASMSKLNLAILLVHVDLLKLDLYTQMSMDYFSFYNVIRSFAAVYLFSVAAGTILFVVFENPVSKIAKSITETDESR